MVRFLKRCLTSLLVIGLMSSNIANAVVLTGTIQNLSEVNQTRFGDGITEFQVNWSVNTTDKGYFYSYGSNSSFALATNITNVEQIVDASSYIFSDVTIGPLCDAACATKEGLHNTPRGMTQAA